MAIDRGDDDVEPVWVAFIIKSGKISPGRTPYGVSIGYYCQPD